MYYFDVKNNSFPQAVEIFSAFFKDPLIGEGPADREMNAVDSEFRKNLSDEQRRVS